MSWRTAAMALTVLGGLLSITELARLKWIGPWVRVLFPLGVYYSAPYIMMYYKFYPILGIWQIGYTLWKLVVETLLFALAIALVLGAVYYVLSTVWLFQRFRLVRVLVRFWVAEAWLQYVVPQVVQESRVYTGLLFTTGTAMICVGAAIMLAVAIGWGLERAFGNQRVGLVGAVFCLWCATAIQLFAPMPTP